MTTEPQTTRQVDPDREYVVGGGLRWYAAMGQALTALPLPIDDLTAEFGDDIYERMMRDPQVAASVGVLRTAILEDGLRLRPAVEDKDADGYDQAVELVKLCERQLDEIETSVDDVLLDMTQAIALGNRVAEEVFAYDSTFTGRTELVLRRLNVKPRRNLAFVVDAFGNIVGLLGVEAGQPLLHGALLTDEQRTRVLPRSKFAIFTFRPRDNDPRGETVLRPVYNPWWLKMQTWPEYLKYLTQFASPSIDGEVAPDAQDEVTGYDSGGEPILRTAEEAFLAKLLAFRNGSAIARPNGSKLTMLWSQGEGQAFLNAFELFDKQIAKGILYQTLATEEASYGTRAQGTIHESILETIIRQAKRGMCRMVRRDVLRQIVVANAGDQLHPLTPKVGLGDAETQNLQALWTAAAALQRANYFDASQLPKVDELLNLPPRLATPAESEGIADDQGQQEEQGQPPPPASDEGEDGEGDEEEDQP